MLGLKAKTRVLFVHRAAFAFVFSIEEIAAITGARPGTVKSRLHYAKNALRQLLTGESL